MRNKLKSADVSAAKPEEGSFELTTELIRVRAHRFITRLKVFERLIKTTTTATDDKVEVCERYYALCFAKTMQVCIINDLEAHLRGSANLCRLRRHFPFRPPCFHHGG